MYIYINIHIRMNSKEEKGALLPFVILVELLGIQILFQQWDQISLFILPLPLRGPIFQFFFYEVKIQVKEISIEIAHKKT